MERGTTQGELTSTNSTTAPGIPDPGEPHPP
jgi:hypothetical protein